MLDTEQEPKSLSSIELANNLSITISNTTNPTYIKSFNELIEPDSIFILEEMTECDYFSEPCLIQ